MGCCALTAFRIQRNQQGVQAMKLNGIILKAFYDKKISFLMNILSVTEHSVKNEVKGRVWFRFRHPGYFSHIMGIDNDRNHFVLTAAFCANQRIF